VVPNAFFGWLNAAMKTTRPVYGWLAALPLLAACGGGELATPSAPANPPAEALNEPAPSGPPTSDLGAAPGASGVSDDVAKGMRALESNDTTAAKAYFEHALRTNPKDADALYYQGVVAEKTGDKDTAEKSYKAALKVKPDLEQAAVNLSAFYVDAQRYDEALAVAQAGITKHADNGSLHLNAAVAYAGKGDQTSATKEFEAALHVSPGEPMFHLTYGHWLGSWKQLDPALSQLRAARPLAKKGGDAAVGVLASIGHEMHILHAWSDCVPTYDEAIAIKDAAELRTERAACKIGAKDSAGALADLQSAVANDASYAPAHYYLAGELARAGQLKDAVVQLQTFLKLEPNGPMTNGAQEKLRILKQKAGAK
jgi:Tfp pilus assembly protein PilF